MTVKDWVEARARLYERDPEVEAYGIVRSLWEHAGSFAFLVSCNGTKRLMWVGPRGGVSTALRYTASQWEQIVKEMP